jgi:hypothetical protein
MKYDFKGLALMGALIGTAACSSDRLEIPNYNAPTIDGVSKDPQAVQILATGMLQRERTTTVDRTRVPGIFGRELYYYFSTDARWVSNPLIGIGTGASQRLDPGGFVGGQNWFEEFRQARNAKNLMETAAANTGLTDAQKKAINGFAKTLKALGYSYVIETRDTLGMPVDVNDDPNDQPAFVSRDSAYKYISGLLDEAKADLQAGGTAFPFALTTGFTGFNTPADFLKFNRGIAARLLVERAAPRVNCGTPCYTAALAALNESFIRTPTSLADLNVGPYNVYSTTSGDATNTLSLGADGSLFAHASFVTDSPNDARVARKLDKLPTPIASPQNLGIPAEYRFKIYPTNTTPTPIMRNEELVLIRAEARWFTGDKAGAISDLNAVRSISGGLGASTATAGSTDSQFIDALLYERRYSLMMEGRRWVDTRRFNRLNTLPKDLPTHFVAIVQPVPLPECDARNAVGEKIPGC